MAVEKIVYETKGTCSSQIILEIEDDVIKSCVFIGGCNGNLKGISSLVKGQNVSAVLDRLDGITCGSKTTSCPDQLAQCLKQYISKKASVAAI